MMIVAGEEAAHWASSNAIYLILGLQALTLGYLAYATRRIARNQVELAEAMKRLHERND